MKKTAIALCAGLLAVAPLAAQTATEIVTAARDRIDAKTVSTRSRMVILSKDGSTTERLLDQYSSDADSGDRTIVVFQRPASVAGTRFLTIERKGAEDDRWIFLPSLGKVRRIAASEGSGSFVGTDMSYDDISAANRDVSEDDHTLLREEAIGGSPCYVIESKPKDASFQYSKMVQWIDKETKVVRRVELFDRKGVHVKTLETLRFETVQGRLTPMETRMSTIAAKTSTTIIVEIVKYDQPIPEGVFTTDYLSTGRVR
ncbi:MAG TPA: outer membrane lipoprotein-sorting protein [Treponemataceae bacterium]|jgi:outer membrane lipoprotein-sorting protein|nr:outer membrane lipoprotein-sorting protein [Treponemataceae bacterium]